MHLRLTVFLIALGLGAGALAQDLSTEQGKLSYAIGDGFSEFKIGFVNIPKVLDKAPQAQAARTRIEKEFAPKHCIQNEYS